MGLLTDILKEIPQAAVLKEKIASIEAKYAAADTENAILKDDLREAKAEITKLQKQIEELTHKDDLDETECLLLRRLADRSDGVCNVVTLYGAINLPTQRIQYHLTRLANNGYVTNYGVDEDDYYELLQQGREYLIVNGYL